jgi:hypothetical protein
VRPHPPVDEVGDAAGTIDPSLDKLVAEVDEVAPERARISSCNHVPNGVVVFQEGTRVSNQAT